MWQTFLNQLPDAAHGPFAIIGYVCLIAAYVFVATERARLKQISRSLRDLPEDDRAKVIRLQYPTFPRSGLSPEQFLRSQRQRFLFLAFLATLIVGAIIIVTAIQRSIPVSTRTVNADWQMNLTLEGVNVTAGRNKIGGYSCELEKRNNIKPIRIPRSSTVDLDFVVHLVVDNVYERHRNLVYPVGLSTTWDHKVFTIYDGRDADAARASHPGRFLERELLHSVALRTPDAPGKHYVLIVSGAALTAEQLFAASETGEETPESLWSIPLSQLDRGECGTFVNHSFAHTRRNMENALFPVVAIPIEIT